VISLPFLHRLDGLLDQSLVFLAASAERRASLAHPRRPPPQSPPRFPRPGRLDGGVQGQEIGLEGDLIDGLDILPVSSLERVILADGVHQLLHLGIAFSTTTLASPIMALAWLR
jgi:hypothetical protein